MKCKGSQELQSLAKQILRIEMNNTLIKTAEIALVRSLGEQVQGQSKKGQWIYNSAKKLVKASDRELKKLPYISNKDMKKIEGYLTKFFDITGWAGKTKNSVTVISFCLELVEKSKFKYNDQMTDSLNMLFDHNERSGSLKPACLWSGGLAYEKWNSLIN